MKEGYENASEAVRRQLDVLSELNCLGIKLGRFCYCACYTKCNIIKFSFFKYTNYFLDLNSLNGK